MKRIICIIFMLLFSVVSAYSQSAGTKKCKTCGKPIKECQYKGKHATNKKTADSQNPKTDSRTTPGVRMRDSRLKYPTQSEPLITDESDEPYPFRRVGKCPLSDELNPMDGGIILGWTTIEEAVAAGGTRDDGSYSSSKNVRINGRTYWDHQSDGIIESLYFTHSDGLPTSWTKTGLDFDMSYQQWIRWFNSHGFNIYVNKEPQEGNHYSGGRCFQAEINAYNSSSQLVFNLDFNYQKGTSSVYDSKTLYSITLTRVHRIKTRTTDYGSFASINGVKPTIETLPQLSTRGIKTDETCATNGDFKYYLVPEIKSVKGKHIYISNTIYRVTVGDNSAKYLPSEWPKNGGTTMTLEKWTEYFKKHGFVVTVDETHNSSEIYPKVEATQPYYGITISLEFTQESLSSDRTASYYNIEFL